MADTSGLSTGAQWRRRGTGLSDRMALEMLAFDCVSPAASLLVAVATAAVIAAAATAARPMSPLTAELSSGSFRPNGSLSEVGGARF